MEIERRPSTTVTVGDVAIGGDAPCVVQSMTTTDTSDSQATLAQIGALAEAGCEIVRVAIPSSAALDGFARVCERSPMPVVADIHFDHRLAIEASRRGAAKLRINPGNIGSTEKVDAVIDAASEAGIPIRIGVNAGSLASEFAEKPWPLEGRLIASAIAFCEHFESRDFRDIVVSAKASSVRATVSAQRRLAEELPYPLHVGVTEAGYETGGIVKSAVGIGLLLAEGIGDTIRVSLTGDPVREIEVAWEILAALDLRRHGPELVSCPTCGRCQVDLVSMAEEVRTRLSGIDVPVKVAVMGCAVNGPGEAREADVGIAAGGGVAVVFARGEEVRKVPEDEAVDALFDELARIGPPSEA